MNQRDFACRIYFASCLRILTENSAHISNGSYIAESLADILLPKKEDTRSAEEIAREVYAKIGLKVIE